MKQTKPTSLRKSSKETLVSDSPRTLLHVDLWTDLPSTDVASARSGEINVLPSALAMVGDLLAVAGGEFRTSSSTSLSAWFGDTLQAVSAARRLQRLVRGFSRASVGGPLYACFTLTSGNDPDIVDDATLLSSVNAFKHTASEEILFAGAICEDAAEIPGLQFKVPLAATLAKRADVPQTTILQLLPPAHMDGFIDEPIEPRVRVEDKPPAAPGTPPIGAQSPIFIEPSLTHKKETSQPATSSKVNKIDPSFDVPGPKISPRWAIIGVSTVAAVAAILIFTPIFKSSPNQTSNPTSKPPQPVTSGSEKAPTPPPPVATPPPTQPAIAAKPATSPKQNEPPSTRAKKEGAPEEPRPTRGTHAVTFSQEEIDILIARADKDTGDGKFDKAIEEYNTVLNQDPSNALAKKGLAKAIHNKSHN
jgi:hypothetical protein